MSLFLHHPFPFPIIAQICNTQERPNTYRLPDCRMPMPGSGGGRGRPCLGVYSETLTTSALNTVLLVTLESFASLLIVEQPRFRLILASIGHHKLAKRPQAFVTTQAALNSNRCPAGSLAMLCARVKSPAARQVPRRASMREDRSLSSLPRGPQCAVPSPQRGLAEDQRPPSYAQAVSETRAGCHVRGPPLG